MYSDGVQYSGWDAGGNQFISGKIQEMDAQTAEDAKKLGVSDEINLSLTIGAMAKADEEITKELENIILISENEREKSQVDLEDLARNTPMDA